MKLDLVALKKLAEGATPGEWTVGEDTTSDGALYPCGINGPRFAIINGMDDCSEEDAAFIAAFNPLVAKELIRRLEVMRDALIFAVDDSLVGRKAKKALEECE